MINTPDSIEKFIAGIPKAELHLHIEGSFEPELMFEIAERNNVPIRFNSIAEIKAAYNFNNLQEFLDIYYEGAGVLLYEQDFYDLTYSYMKKAAEDNVLHAEIFFDPQTHTDRGVPFRDVITGIYNALTDAKKNLGISSKLIMSFLRHLSAESAMETLDQSLPYKHWITAVGLDSSEAGNPPIKFKLVFETAIANGFLTVAHAGEEGPAEYVWEALNHLAVSRIDHGNRSLEDEQLVMHLVERKMPLTVCPLSNLKLRVVKDMKDHPLKIMIQKGLVVTVNSDDPAYFGGYINTNFIETAKAIDLSYNDILILAVNSFNASFLDDAEKAVLIALVNEYQLQFTSRQ